MLRKSINTLTVAVALLATAPVLATADDSDGDLDKNYNNGKNSSIQLGPRPFYLVDDMDEGALKDLENGIEVEGVRYGSILARMDRRQGANAWLSMGLREGRNREIRRVLDHLGLQVSRLLRIAYGPFQLGALEARGVDELTGKVVREQLGRKLLDGLIEPPRSQMPRVRSKAKDDPPQESRPDGDRPTESRPDGDRPTE